jgi:hypothetical protein
MRREDTAITTIPPAGSREKGRGAPRARLAGESECAPAGDRMSASAAGAAAVLADGRRRRRRTALGPLPRADAPAGERRGSK